MQSGARDQSSCVLPPIPSYAAARSLNSRSSDLSNERPLREKERPAPVLGSRCGSTPRTPRGRRSTQGGQIFTLLNMEQEAAPSIGVAVRFGDALCLKTRSPIPTPLFSAWRTASSGRAGRKRPAGWSLVPTTMLLKWCETSLPNVSLVNAWLREASASWRTTPLALGQLQLTSIPKGWRTSRTTRSR